MLRDLFAVVDLDGSGELDKAEFTEIVKSFSPQMANPARVDKWWHLMTEVKPL